MDRTTKRLIHKHGLKLVMAPLEEGEMWAAGEGFSSIGRSHSIVALDACAIGLTPGEAVRKWVESYAL